MKVIHTEYPTCYQCGFVNYSIKLLSLPEKEGGEDWRGRVPPKYWHAAQRRYIRH